MIAPSNKQYKEESELLKKTVEWLEPQQRDGIKVIRIVDRYTKGYSDLFISARGRFVVAELKDDTGTATPHQELFIEEMIATGAVGGVCRSVKDIADLINEALYCKHKDPHIYGCKFCDICGKEVKRP